MAPSSSVLGLSSLYQIVCIGRYWLGGSGGSMLRQFRASDSSEVVDRMISRLYRKVCNLRVGRGALHLIEVHYWKLETLLDPG